jgi:hypothetical protein
VDYGAALEMRFGATRRGFESRPLRQNPQADGVAELRLGPSVGECWLAAEGAHSVVVIN